MPTELKQRARELWDQVCNSKGRSPNDWIWCGEQYECVLEVIVAALQAQQPVPMLLFCPACNAQHVDAPDERTPDWNNPPHRSHLCHGCGHIWRPADVATTGVAAIATKGSNDGNPVPAQQPGAQAAAGFETWLDHDWPLWRNDPSHPSVARCRRAWEAAMTLLPSPPPQPPSIPEPSGDDVDAACRAFDPDGSFNCYSTVK